MDRFDADMAKEIGEALGVEVQFTVIEWGKKADGAGKQEH